MSERRFSLAGALQGRLVGTDRGGLASHELAAPRLAALEGLVVAVVIAADRKEPDDDDPERGADHHPEGENEHSRLPFRAPGAVRIPDDPNARDVPPWRAPVDVQLAVEAREVRKRFGSVTALDGLTLGIAPGEIYGLLGPNGSGKTTFIRSLAAVLRPDAGELRIFGALPRAAVSGGTVGYMTQAAALYGELSVEENLRFFGALEGVADVDAKLEDALRHVDLLDRRGSAVRTLSGGMRTRVSLAATLLHQPRLLLLDEPTVGIDPALRREFWEHFRSLAASGVTILVSSHVMDEAARCDRLGLIRAGRLLAEGSAQELVRRAGTHDLEGAFLALSAAPS